MRFRSFMIGLVLLCFSMVGTASAAPIIYMGSTGTASGTATFNTSLGSTTVTLQNTTGGGALWEGSIGQSLTAIDIFTSGGTITGLASASTTGAINCYQVPDGNPCPSVSPGASPYNWVWDGSDTLTAYQLHPDGILNNMVLSGDGLRANQNHNPYLLTTTFFLSNTGLIDITGVKFYFGTSGDSAGGTRNPPPNPTPVPEPATMMLLGTGLLAAFRVKKKAKA